MNKTTKIVAGIIFLILIVYLLNDLGIINLGSFFGGSGNALAILAEKTKSVSIKRAKELNWNEARGDEKLFDQDSVLTFESSTALVNFLSGPKMTVLENSLVVISAPKNPGDPLELTLGRGGYRLSVAQNQKVKINGISFTAKNNSEVLANYENDKPMVKVVSGEVDVLPLELGAPATVAHQGQSVPVNVRVVAGPSPIALSNQSPTGTPASTAMAASSPTSSASPVPTATQAPSPIPVATATTAPARKKVLPKPTPSPTPKKKAKKMLQFKVIREYNNGDAGGATGGQ